MAQQTGAERTTSSRRTVVFLAMDALGHIHPIISIANELGRRGHRAVILTIRQFKSATKLQEMGLEVAHCREESADKLDARVEDSEAKMVEIMKPLAEFFRKGLPGTYEVTYSIDGALGKHLDDIIEYHDLIRTKLESYKPDFIMVDHIVWIPCIVQVAPRWGRIYSGYPSAILSALDDNYSAGFGLKPEENSPEMKAFEHKCKAALREKIRRFCAEQGVPDWPAQLDLLPTSPYLNFYFGPEELGLDKIPQYKKLPEVWHRLEHTIEEPPFERAREFEIPAELKALPGRLIYFSMGTLVTSDIQLINRLTEMFSKSPNKFIISMGQMHKHIKLYPNMWGQEYVDQKSVLAKADLFITHGGHNSIIEAFYHGVPGLLVLPVFADQFDSAQRIEDCGFGIRLNPFDCTQSELLQSIDSLLANSELRDRMQSISSRLKSIRYHELAADKLEEFLSL